MSRVRVLVDVEIHNEKLRAVMDQTGAEVVPVPEPREESRPLDADLLRGTHLFFCTFPPTNFHAFDSLKLIQLASAGYNQILDLGLADRGIRVCNALGVFDIPIAEWNVAMMVALARDLRGMIRNQEAGVWDRSARFQREVRGSVVGIWGYGGIGRETARLAKNMGMTVRVLSRRGIQSRDGIYRVPGTGDPDGSLPDEVYLSGNEEQFLSGLDFLIVAVPLTPTTEGMIGEAELRSLPETAFLLNPARGPIVDEQALLRGLSQGWIAGAALDTHYHYPMPSDHPLWKFPNVIMTPHISGSSSSPHYLDRVWDIFAANVARFVDGRPLVNELTPAQLRGE